MTLLVFYSAYLAAYVYQFLDEKESARFYVLNPRLNPDNAPDFYRRKGSYSVFPLVAERVAPMLAEGFYPVPCSALPLGAHHALEEYLERGYSVASPVIKTASGSLWRAYAVVGAPGPEMRYRANIVKGGRGCGPMREYAADRVEAGEAHYA